jgi:TPR repeat protein
VDKNLSKAMNFFQQAVQLNYPSAMYNLGLSYQNEKAVQKTIKLLIITFIETAKIGNFEFMNKYFIYLSEGIRVQRNI